MQHWHDYHTPATVDEAISLLTSYAGNAKIIAGGTDLMIDLNHTQEYPEPLGALVDVTRIAEMTRIEERGGLIYLGAAVTHTAIVHSALIEQEATCLVESCGVVGGPQVRNVGTIGGNVAHALPAGDGTTSLMVLDAEAEVAWHDGRREWLPLANLFAGPGKSALDSSRDVLVGFRFHPSQPDEASAFKRIMRPQGVALPILGCGVWVKLDEKHENYADVRICIGPVAPTPIRASDVEEAIIGRPITNETLDLAVKTARETLHPRTSKYRSTAAYRVEMIETLLRQALPLASQRALSGEIHAEGVGLG